MAKDRLRWMHPRKGESGSTFCRRMGWGVGDVLWHSVTADGQGVPDNPKPHKVLRLDCAHAGVDLGQCDVELEHIGYGYSSCSNMVMDGLRTGSLVSDPIRCWPWAKEENAHDDEG